ncbi:MAG: hypothetical protein ABR970_03270 [Roseiarcus sp.]|jgi:hypothetical protein
MDTSRSSAAVIGDQGAAEAGVGRLAAAGFAMTNLGVVGKECRADEEVVGFCKWAIG